VKKIAISGVTLSGNMGGVAMLKTTQDQLSRKFPGAKFYLLSVDPNADLYEEGLPGVSIVPVPAAQLVGLCLPVSLVLWPLIRFGWVRAFMRRFALFYALDEADIVIDLCGIAFVDGRGLPLLAYNLACCLPAIVLGTPIAKLSQALGPFRTVTNRLTARFVLGRCDLVVGRGAASAQHLQDLGLLTTQTLPDVTFCLEVPDAAQRIAKQRLSELGIKGSFIVVSPSEVARRLVDGRGGLLVEEIANMVKAIAGSVSAILVLPHSYGKAGSKNNDLEICHQLAKGLSDLDKVFLIDSVKDPILLRAIIGHADTFVGCRFHAAVSALTMGVPSIIIGWSHKYREMAAMFGSEEWVIDAREFDARVGILKWNGIQSCHDSLRQKLLSCQPAISREARRNFDLDCRVLE
jgi:colanic acid/amylovoran biosynthesis protein